MEKCRANLNLVLELLVSVTFHMSGALVCDNAKKQREENTFTHSYTNTDTNIHIIIDRKCSESEQSHKKTLEQRRSTATRYTFQAHLDSCKMDIMSV